MLRKLLKYDMKSMNRAMLPGYITIIIIALLTKGSILLAKQFAFMNFISGLFIVAFVIAIGGIYFYVTLASVLKFYRSIIKEEGYLTHTLPIKKSTIINSKLITFLIHFIITFVITVLAGLLLLEDYSIFGTLFHSFDLFVTYLGYSTPWVIIFLVFTFIIGIISNILLFYLSMCLGQTRNDKKLLYSFIYGVILSTITQIIGTIFVLILGLANPEVMNSANNVIPDKSFIDTVFGYSAILSVILTAIYYIVSVKILDKKLNLE